MPQMDGFEVLRRIRADAGTAGVPVVMISANPDPDLRARAIAAGASDLFLSKLSDLGGLPKRLMEYVRCEPPAADAKA